MTEDTRTKDDAGQPMMTFNDMPGSNEHEEKSDSSEMGDYDLNFPSMRDAAEVKAEKERELADPIGVSLEKYGEEKISDLNEILKAVCSKEDYADLSDSGIGNDVTLIGALLEYQPRLERLLKRTDGIDLSHPANRDAQLRAKGDIKELVDRALHDARSRVAERHGGIPGRVHGKFE
jgi:hypothetical protein